MGDDRAARPWQRELTATLTNDFLVDTLGQAHRHFVGRPGRFAPILSWRRINAVLTQTRLSDGWLKIVDGGKRVAASSYSRKSGTRSTLDPAALTRLLRRGATLVVDAIDELSDSVAAAASQLEYLLHERVQANAYCGWGEAIGYGVHRDAHDVIIMQVDGRKEWSIFGPGLVDPAKPPPRAPWDNLKLNAHPEEPIWRGVLEDGDLLYIPRGFFHGVQALGVPSLHITFGFNSRSGLHLFDWLRDAARRRASFREKLPTFAGAEARAAYVEQFRRELLALCTPDMVERFLEQHDRNADGRGRMSLPWSVLPAVLPPAKQTQVRWVPPRPVQLRQLENGAEVELGMHRQRWRFPNAVAPLLLHLSEVKVATVEQLCRRGSGVVAEPEVRAFVADLVLKGLAAVVAPVARR